MHSTQRTAHRAQSTAHGYLTHYIQIVTMSTERMLTTAPTCRNQITLKRRNDIIGALRALDVHRKQHNSLHCWTETDTKSLFLWCSVFRYMPMMFSVQVHTYDVQCSGTCLWCSVFRYIPTQIVFNTVCIYQLTHCFSQHTCLFIQDSGLFASPLTH